MHRFHAALLFALVLGCGDDNPNSGDEPLTSGSSSTTATTMDMDASTSGSTDPVDVTTASDDSTTGSHGEDTGSSEDGSSSGEPDGLDPLVSWQPLLADAAERAAALNPSATLSLVGARGVGPDGMVDLSNVDSEPLIEFRFSDTASDSGVTVRYTDNSFDPDADALEPSVSPINGSGLVFAPITETVGLPSFVDIAQRIAATEGCAAFAGTPDDGINIRMEYVFENYVVADARTASGSTEADAFSLDFAACS